MSCRVAWQSERYWHHCRAAQKEEEEECKSHAHLARPVAIGVGSTACVMPQGTAPQVLSSLQKQSWGKMGFGRPPGWAVLCRCQEGVLQCRFETREVKQM